MSSKSKPKAKPVDRAVPTLKKSKKTDGAKVSTTKATTTSMKASSLWSSNPSLQAAANAWDAAADAIDQKRIKIDDLKGQLAAAQADQRGNRRTWTDSMKHVLASVALVTQGSADQVHDLGFDVRVTTTSGPLAVPAGLTAMPTTVVGEVSVKWELGFARHGFIVQHATDVANPATYSLPVPSTKSKFKLEGLTSNSVVHVRVAAIDPASPSGQSPYCDWVIATAH